MLAKNLLIIRVGRLFDLEIFDGIFGLHVEQGFELRLVKELV